jgi:type IV fimbrial biogenesis protein FimT
VPSLIGDTVAVNLNMHSAARASQAGFSLIEQLMAATIVAVLACVAAPSLGHLAHRLQLQATQFDYIANLRYARSAAVAKNRRMVFCPSADGRHCKDRADWSGGWLLAGDRNHDGQPDGAPLRVGRISPDLIILGTAGRRQVRFLPDGSARGSNLSLLLCLAGDAHRTLRVVVSNAGRVRGASATPAQAARCTSARR